MSGDDVGVGVDHRDKGLGHVLVADTRRFEQRPVRGALRPLGDPVRSQRPRDSELYRSCSSPQKPTAPRLGGGEISAPAQPGVNHARESRRARVAAPEMVVQTVLQFHDDRQYPRRRQKSKTGFGLTIPRSRGSVEGDEIEVTIHHSRALVATTLTTGPDA